MSSPTKSPEPNVHFLEDARKKLSQEARQRFRVLLWELFGNTPETQIYVRDSFDGYTKDHTKKGVLPVEIHVQDTIRHHVVKFGTREAVAQDVDGYDLYKNVCAFRSRILLAVHDHPFPDEEPFDGWLAIIYEDAGQYYGGLPETEPFFLERAVLELMRNHHLDAASLDRTLREIFTDLYSSCYHTARTNRESAINFYRDKLGNAWPAWTKPELFSQRRKLLSLLTKGDSDHCSNDPEYLDAYEYFRWAMMSEVKNYPERIPNTLVGLSHGDLHGRNVMVGLHRDEILYPTLYDYGEMDWDNVIAWDFVKLEMEIKVRTLSLLYDIDEAARDELLKTMPPLGSGDSKEEYQIEDAKFQWFIFEFEKKLAEMTSRIRPIPLTSRIPSPVVSADCSSEFLKKALNIFTRIRAEAAFIFQNYLTGQRGDEPDAAGVRQNQAWREEYYFALGAYGLNVAKFNYQSREHSIALISAGVAIANMEGVREELRRQCQSNDQPAPLPMSYRIPMAWAYEKWKAKAEVTEVAIYFHQIRDQFLHATPLLSAFAMILISNVEERTWFKRQFEQLLPQTVFYRETETFMRLIRIYHNEAKENWTDRDNLPQDISYMRYQEALRLTENYFELTKEYYPAVRAIAFSLFLRRTDHAKELAIRLIQTCKAPRTETDEELFWFLVSLADAEFILENIPRGVELYRKALQLLSSENKEFANTAVNSTKQTVQLLSEQTKTAFQTVLNDFPELCSDA